MTIVIAKKFDESIVILSDTKITYHENLVPKDRKNLRSDPVLDASLKTIILYPNICVSYSGDPKSACDVIKEFKKLLEESADLKSNFSSKRCARYLYEILIESRADAEFILSIVDKFSSEPELSIFRISRDIDENDLESSSSVWIGALDAFEEFQKLFHEQKAKNNNDRSSFSSAFHSLITQQKIQSVGDFEITVFYEPKLGFHYVSTFWGLQTVGPIENLEANEEITIGTGTTEKGDYWEMCFESQILSNPAVAIYFAKGHFGIFFHPPKVLENEGNGVVIKDVNTRGFLNIILQRYGIPLKGFEVRDDAIYPISFPLVKVSLENHSMSKINNSSDGWV
ncbi:MAG: hypothetical protein KA099_01945 [Alphaproteobacteria bacterium]|nr:hypothetical protein [Alphaproteobacteria bacterium]MBP7758603.1 hypothetical protein [Alphaproteobacteria bacterium]MBP7762035.1 hypothetical protein [Alphaproteobacteria bacterium]MBP7904064.1 hypothetical protein [Alphaproteobacteria bacterium]